MSRRRILPLIEHAVKKPAFGCKMCGQCILHSTGMTCPMTCPKTLRNGPCGGVRENGNCEVIPDMRCVWVVAEHRSSSALLPRSWREEINDLHPPVDNQLTGTSSWLNLVTGRDRQVPAGWDHETARQLPHAHEQENEGEHADTETLELSLVEAEPPGIQPNETRARTPAHAERHP